MKFKNFFTNKINILVGHVARRRDEGWTTNINKRQLRSGKRVAEETVAKMAS